MSSSPVLVIFVIILLIKCHYSWKFTSSTFKKFIIATSIAMPILNPISIANAADRIDPALVGEFDTSGLIMKDKIKVYALDDPKIKGITMYFSEFEKPVTEKLSSKNFFEDPTSSSLACVASNNVKIGDDVDKSPSGETIYSESKNLISTKSLNVRRIVDTDAKNIVYVSYSSRLDKKSDKNKARFTSSLCSVHYN